MPAVSLLLLRSSDINLAAWDACVAASPDRGGLPYAFSWWLRLAAGRWEGVVEPDGRGGYASVLALPVRRRPWGREVGQPPFTQQLGLLRTAASQHRELADYLDLAAGRYARFYTQLGVAQPWPVLPPELGFAVSSRQNFHLSLAPPYPALLAGYCADYRRRLRRPAAGPLADVRPASSAQPLIALFRQEQGARIAGLQARHYVVLSQLLAQAQHRGQALILEVRAPATNELLAGAAFVREPSVLIYLFAASTAAGRAAGGPLRLLDYAIRQHAGTAGLVLDFEGGTIPSIARFFANFGAAPVSYAALTSTRPPWPPRLLNLHKWMRP